MVNKRQPGIPASLQLQNLRVEPASPADNAPVTPPPLLCAQLQQTRTEDALEEQFGFPLFTEGEDKLGWLTNIQPVSVRQLILRAVSHAVTLSSSACPFLCPSSTGVALNATTWVVQHPSGVLHHVLHQVAHIIVASART